MALRRWLERAFVIVAIGCVGAAGGAGAQMVSDAASSAEGGTETAAEETKATSYAPVDAGPIELEVSLSERQLRVIQGGQVVKSYAVAIGKHNHPTPQGSFRAGRVVWNPRWVPPSAPWAKGKKARGPGDPNNPMGKVKIFFKEPDYYIHGTNDEASLGKAASHGCVRMANEDIVELAQVVMEHGGESRPASWFQRVISFVKSSSEVRLSNAVPVRVTS